MGYSCNKICGECRHFYVYLEDESVCNCCERQCAKGHCCKVNFPVCQDFSALDANEVISRAHNKLVKDILIHTTIKEILDRSKNSVPNDEQDKRQHLLPDMYAGLLHSVTGEPLQSPINNYRRVEICGWEWKYGFTDVKGTYFSEEKTNEYNRLAAISLSEVSFPRALYHWGYFNQIGLFETMTSNRPVYVVSLSQTSSFIFIQKDMQVTFDVGSISLIME